MGRVTRRVAFLKLWKIWQPSVPNTGTRPWATSSARSATTSGVHKLESLARMEEPRFR